MFIARSKRSEVFYPHLIKPGDEIDLQAYTTNDVICNLVARGYYSPVWGEIEDEDLTEMLGGIESG